MKRRLKLEKEPGEHTGSSQVSPARAETGLGIERKGKESGGPLKGSIGDGKHLRRGGRSYGPLGGGGEG